MGTRIQASVPRRLIPLFDEKLFERRLYGLCHFDVRGHDGLNKPTSHYKRLFFKDSTRAFEHDLKIIPVFLRSVFDFRPFSDILTSEDDNDSLLFDLIREAIQVGRPRQCRGSDKSSRSIDFVLRDTEITLIVLCVLEKFTD